MRRFNLLIPELDRVSVGEAVGSQQIVARLYELAEGSQISAYHFHHALEEWLIVVAGSPRVRTAGGERVLGEGDVLCFPAGPGGGHEVTGPGTVLVLSPIAALDVVEFPETGEVELRPAGTLLRHDSPGDPWDGGTSEPVNLRDIAVEAETGAPPGYRVRAASIGRRIGAEQLGAGIYELDPGESTWPYHYEGVEEEWLIVLSGAPTLRGADGEHELSPGDLVCFPTGPEGGHKVSNRSDAVARVVMLSTIPANELSICVYPDSGKLGVWPWPGKRLRLDDEQIGYWDGEV